MQAETTYNWDDIEVGRFDLNDSENFFTQPHLKHEKFVGEDIDLIRSMASTNLHEKYSAGEPVETAPKKKKTKTPKKLKRPSKAPAVSFEGADNKENSLPWHNARGDVQNNELTSDTNRRPANLLTHPNDLQAQPKETNLVAAVTLAPHAYEFKDIYQKKKEEKMKKLLEEEKKNRIFHSKPVPKSVIKPRDKDPSPVRSEVKATAPITPMVLKNSREADERRRQRIEEWKAKNGTAKYSSREAAILQNEPFRPKRSALGSQAQPFNLHVERRLEERKLFDEQFRRTAEEKQRQEEETRRKREEEIIKELRKRTSFKARPNPFK